MTKNNRALRATASTQADREIIAEMGKLGLLGPTIPEEYGGAETSYASYGLIAGEIERVDSGYRSLMSVQSSLAMYPIRAHGDKTQREKYWPKPASGEWLGCFSLTEPDAGSCLGSMRTRMEKGSGGHCLTVNMMRISNTSDADVMVVWTKSKAHESAIRGSVLDRSTKGLSTPTIENKVAFS